MRTVLDSASQFIFQIGRSLLAGTIRKNRLSLNMQTDVFQFLFADKGIIAERGYKEYGRDDFDDRYFTDEWYVKYDQNGDGCAVEFPIKMKSCVTWTRCKAFSKKIEIHVKKLFFERLYVFVVKKRV